MKAADRTDHRENNEPDAPPDAPFGGESGRITEAVRRKLRLTRAVCLLEAAEIAEINESVIAEHAGQKRANSAERVAAYRARRRARNEKEVGGVYAPDDPIARDLIRKIGKAMSEGTLAIDDLLQLFESKPEPGDRAEEPTKEETDAESETMARCQAILGAANLRRFLFQLLIKLLMPRTAASRTDT